MEDECFASLSDIVFVSTTKVQYDAPLKGAFFIKTFLNNNLKLKEVCIKIQMMEGFVWIKARIAMND